MREDVQVVYDRFAEKHHGEIDVFLLAETMFNAGAAAGIRMSAGFADLTTTLRHMRRDQAHMLDRTDELLALVRGIVSLAEDELA